ncbi:MAG: alpha-N-arabinofuranosidase [Clostridia bacterium]|nr:alpha-N-arabinofuranosidase [Clostridia bacterium]
MKKLTVVCPEATGTIAPEIYGHFSEHIGGVFYDGLWVGKDSEIPNVNGFRKDIVEKFRAINPPVLRWPGGCYAETYHWRDGIGENRPVRPNWWKKHDGRDEPNHVGTHEFIEFCELVGAKPYFAVNVTSITPMEARDWMDYCLSPQGSTTLALEREKNGHPEPFDIPYWGVGNENWGGGGNMTADYYALEYRRFATVMKNLCWDKSDLIAGGANGADYSWTKDLVSNLAGSHAPVDGMSFHYYCGKSGDCVDYDENDWYILLGKAEKMEELIRRHYAFTVGHGMQDKMKLVIDEWGCWHPDGSGPSKGYNLFEQQSTMRDAVITALTLNIFNNNCQAIKMANVAQLCNNLHCLFLAGGENCIVTPTYHVFDMFKAHQGATCLRTLMTDNDDLKEKVSGSASVKDDVMTITMANCSCTEDIDVLPELLGLNRTVKSASMTVLAADDMHAHNTFEAPDAVVPVTCAADLTKPVTVPKAGVVTLTITLGE